MVRKSNSKRKGIQRGVQKGIRTNAGTQRGSSSYWTLKAERWLETIAIKAFGAVVALSMAYNLVPFTTTPEGDYVVKAKKGLRAYGMYRILTGFVMVYRVVAVIKVCTQEEFNTATLLAFVGGLVYCNCWTISFYSPSETASVLNNFNRILSYLQTQADRELRMYSELRLSLKVIATVLLIIPCTICTGIANGMLFGGLPTSFIRLADFFIGITVENRIWWQLLFLPFEIIAAFTLLLTACIVCVYALSALHLSRLFGEEIRSVKVENLASRDKVEQMYIFWEVCEKISRTWLIVHIFSIIVSISCAAVIHINVAIKYTNLPLLVHSAEVLLGPTFILLLSLGLYDGLVACQISRGVLSDQLTNFDSTGLRHVPVKIRRELVKRIKAMRPIAVPVGSFTEVSFSVMVAVLEEIMNGVLLLLAL